MHRLRPIEAETRREAETRAPHIPGLVIVACEVSAPVLDSKRCGCPPKGLTRAVTLWDCAACGTVQHARRRRCEGCGRSKPRNPRGFGCCDQTWPADQPCGACGRIACEEDIVGCSDLHPELAHFSPQCERGEYTDRAGRVRCVGCLEEVTPGA